MLFVLLCFLLLHVFGTSPAPPQFEVQDSGVSVTLRGISALSDDVIWASGQNGTVIRTTDGGENWEKVHYTRSGARSRNKQWQIFVRCFLHPTRLWISPLWTFATSRRSTRIRRSSSRLQNRQGESLPYISCPIYVHSVRQNVTHFVCVGSLRL